MLEFKPIDHGCIICGTYEEVEQMKIVRDNEESLISFGICTRCQYSMGAELTGHIKTKEPNGWKQFLGERFGKVN